MQEVHFEEHKHIHIHEEGTLWSVVAIAAGLVVGYLLGRKVSRKKELVEA
jgi:hypothetical protein